MSARLAGNPAYEWYRNLPTGVHPKKMKPWDLKADGFPVIHKGQVRCHVVLGEVDGEVSLCSAKPFGARGTTVTHVKKHCAEQGVDLPDHMPGDTEKTQHAIDYYSKLKADHDKAGGTPYTWTAPPNAAPSTPGSVSQAGSYVDLMPEGKIAVPLLKRRGLYNKKKDKKGNLVISKIARENFLTMFDVEEPCSNDGCTTVCFEHEDCVHWSFFEGEDEEFSED